MSYFVCLILLLIVFQAWFITFNLLVTSYSSTDSKSFCNFQHFVYYPRHYFYVAEGNQNVTKNIPLWHKNYFKLKAIKVLKTLKLKKKKKTHSFPLKGKI